MMGGNHNAGTAGYGHVGVVSRVMNMVWLFTQFAGFAIALAGVAILQHQCNTNNSDYNFNGGIFGLGPNNVNSLVSNAGGNPQGNLNGNGPNNQVASGTGNQSYDCGMQYSWYWWVVFFQFAIIVAGILGNFSGLRYGRSGINSFYAVAISQWCIFAYAMAWMTYLYQAWNQDKETHNLWSQGYICGLAGAIVALVGDFLFLMTFGYDDSLATIAYHHKNANTGPVIVEQQPHHMGGHMGGNNMGAVPVGGVHDPHVHMHNTPATIV